MPEDAAPGEQHGSETGGHTDAGATAGAGAAGDTREAGGTSGSRETSTTGTAGATGEADDTGDGRDTGAIGGGRDTGAIGDGRDTGAIGDGRATGAIGDGRGPGDERGTGGAGGTGGTDVPGSTGDGGDVVAKVLGQWRRVLPDLDTGPVAVVGRLTRCAALLRQASDAPLAREGFSRPEFDILSALRREDRELTPGQLAREIYASATSVAKRVRTLEEKGLLARRPDDRDRRVVHLSLTVSGRELVDRIMPEQTAYERSLLAGLGEEERDQLARVLGELLRLLEERERGSREGARRGR